MRLALASAGIALFSACGASRETIPLPLQPISYVDTLPINPPEPRSPNQVERLVRASAGGEIGYAFSLRRLFGARHEAVNITHFDDVVNTAWFEHRIDRGNLTQEDVARGPTTVGPDTSRTLTVIAGKAAGISPGFTVRDASGTIFLFKFDPKGNLHLASAAGVISNRMFHAAGYYVPEDYIVVFDPARLALDPDAEIEEFGKDRKMTEADIYSVLGLTDSLPDGRYLALASKFLPGRPVDPFFFSGVRDDDPNDYYHHQFRRELRGLYVVSSWLNHVDMRYENTLDVFIDPPGFVRHYLIDFAATLGSGTIRPHNPREGREYNFAFWPTMGRVFTLGFYEEGWEDEEYSEIHSSIGWLRGETFRPGEWRANWPNAAFRLVTPADAYWGAKLVGAFSDGQIRAAVAEGALPSAEAADTLARILEVRRDEIVAYWYGRVTPIENVRARMSSDAEPSLEITFDDLGLATGLWMPGETRYIWELEDVYLGIKSKGEGAAGPGARQVLRIKFGEFDGVAGAKTSDATARLRVTAQRGEAAGRRAEIYLRWQGADGGYSVVGLLH